jgi:hypothetical protein
LLYHQKDLFWQIIDLKKLSGKQYKAVRDFIFEEKKYPNLGRVGMEIANVQLPGKGTYFLHVVQGDVHAVRPIVYQ